MVGAEGRVKKGDNRVSHHQTPFACHSAGLKWLAMHLFRHCYPTYLGDGGLELVDLLIFGLEDLVFVCHDAWRGVFWFAGVKYTIHGRRHTRRKGS